MSYDKKEDSAKTKWMLRAIAVGVFLVVWQAIGSALNPVVLSTPTAVAASFASLVEGGAGPYGLWNATAETLEATFVGFLLSIAVGLPIGVLMGMFRRIRIAIYPYVSALYMLPRIALIPLIIIWFGIGFEAIVLVGFILGVFQVIMNTYAGVRDMSKTLLDTADVFQIKGLRRFSLVTFPAILPFFMTGLRLAIGQSLIGVIVAELLLAGSGLGFLMLNQATFFLTSDLMAIVIELAAVGIVLTYGIHYIENRMGYWKLTERAY